MSPSNALFSSPVMSEHGGAHMMGGFGGGTVGGGAGGAGGSSGGVGGGDFDMYGGIDPTMDPELAMAIRISTEEARAQEESRVNALQKETASSSSGAAGNAGGDNAVPFGGFGATDEEDEEALIQRALEMSMADANNNSSSSSSSAAVVPSAAPSLPSTLNKEGDGVVLHDESSKDVEMDADVEEDDVSTLPWSVLV